MVDVKLQNGHVVTAHCPNTGSMRACCEPGRPAYLSRHNNPARRLQYTFELIEMPTSLVGVNTAVPNRLVREAIHDGTIRSLAGYDSVRPKCAMAPIRALTCCLKAGSVAAVLLR